MIDREIFDNLIPDEGKLLASGFAYSDGVYEARWPIADGDFIFILRIAIREGNRAGNAGAQEGPCELTVSSDVLDGEAMSSYLPYSVKDAEGAFIGSINQECNSIAEHVAAICFKTAGQAGQPEAVAQYIRERYGCELEYLWEKFPTDAIWRRRDNSKWFGLVMKVPAKKLGIDSGKDMDVLDLRALDDVIASTDGNRIFPGYHMNKKHWITLILDGRMDNETIFSMIDVSYTLAK